MAIKPPTKAQIAKWEAALGIKVDIPEIDTTTPLPKNRPLNRSFQAEGVLHALVHPDYPEKPMITKVCGTCGTAFRTTYKATGYCSDMCRRESMRNYGINWHVDYNTRSEVESWGGIVPPFTVPPEALAVMKYLVAQAEESQGFPIAQWQPPTKSSSNSSSLKKDIPVSPKPLKEIPVPKEPVVLDTSLLELDLDLDSPWSI